MTRGILYTGALAVLLGMGLGMASRAFTQNGPPPPQVQVQSFAVARNDPLTTTGVHPADVLGVGGFPLIPCEQLGLLCNDPDAAASDDISGLSFGWDFVASGLPAWQFSVAAGSQGRAGTAVRAEANCSPPEPQADVFETGLDGSNLQDLDGNGQACAGNQGFGLGLSEGATPDNLDSLERDPCQFVDLGCDGLPEEPLLFTLAPGSPSLTFLNVSSADILITGGEYLPSLWAGRADLGLAATDVIDALCIREDGDGAFGRGDQVLFSLAPGSPTLTTLAAGPADLLRPAPPRVAYPASQLGLEATDDVDALACAAEVTFYDQFLPLMFTSQ